MADLSSILGGMVQGFKDFGTGLVDMFGTGGAAIGDAIASIQSGRATTKNQDDFRKWLYNTDSTKDAAAKGLGTALNGVSTVADVIPGTQAVTANPLFNGLQGAIGGVADELKMNGENADWGRAAQRAGVGAASGLASGYAGQALGKSGNKLLSNGLTRGAVSGALGGGIANAGYTGIEGGSVQDMINAGLYGAQTGALVGGTTGLARELIKPNHKMDVALTDDEKADRIANIDDQLGKLDLSTPEGNARYNELMNARNNYADNRKAQFELLQKTNPMTDDYHTGIRSPEEIYTLKNIVDSYNQDNNFTYPDFTLADAQNALASGNINVYGSKPIEPGAFASPSKMMATDYAGGGEVYTKNIPLEDFAFIESGDEGNYLPVTKNTRTVADLMNEPKQKTVADLMLSPEQEEFFKGSTMRDENGKLMRVYHSSPNKFTTFDDSKLGENTAYTNTAFGHFVTPDADFSSRFMDIDNKGTKGNMMELYANVKKPITHPYNADYKYKGADLDNIVENYFKATDDLEDLNFLKQAAKDNGTSLYEAYVDNMDIDSDPFEAAQWDREALMKKGYDAVEMVEGLKSGLVDGSTDNTPISSYAVFSGNQLKDVNNLKPTTDADIMRSVALPGSNKKAKITNGVKRIGSDNVAPVDESTLPKGWKELRDILDEKYVDDITKKFGYKNGDFSKITPEQYEKYILDVQTSPGKKKGWQNQFEFKKSYMDADEYKKELKNMAMYEAKRKAINDIQNMDLPQAQKNAIDTAINSMDYYATDDNRRYLSHYMPGGEGKEMFANNAASEADAEFSDRLGIGRSNTIKRNNIWSEDLNASGEYKPDEYALAVDPLLNKENAVSTLAHERLHSFQFEAPQGRYDKRVLDAYNELSKDLKPYLHDQATVDKRYGKYYSKDNLDGKYWASNIEQESRMMQQYLDNKGYTNRTVDGPRKNEYGEEINKAFDKFFDKLRTLSKKGVALPAITALLGGGAIMAATQGDDKKKKSEVK